MIDICKVKTYGWEEAIRGMRNPMNSWEESDSGYCDISNHIGCMNCVKRNRNNGRGCSKPGKEMFNGSFEIGIKDLSLMKKLSAAGTDHRKFMRMITVYADITAPLYWWKEFDTYKVGTVANSCSTMHKIHEKEFTLEDFSMEHLTDAHGTQLLLDTIDFLNEHRRWYNIENDYAIKKNHWWQMIQLLPSSYNQKRTVMMNYEVLANIYKSRKNHKLDEWLDFCDWTVSLPYSELITGLEQSSNL